MIQYSIKALTFTLLSLVMAETTFSASVVQEPNPAEKTDSSESLLNAKVEYYRQLYPEIMFMILKGGKDIQDDMTVLNLMLGDQPKSLDYEHPSTARDDLMYVSVERIRMMLQAYAPSSSLFEVSNPPGGQELVCVLTINPTEVAASSMQATESLLDIPRKFLRKIPQELQLSPTDFLEFVIDHEVYHCLKSRYVGPQLMSSKEFWAEYNHFSNEQGADAYALGMHIKNRGEVSTFAKNILRIRGMALHSADPNHLTCKAIAQVLKIPSDQISEMNSRQIFDLANTIKVQLSGSYDEYVQFLASAVQAMQEIGVGELISEELQNRIKGINSDPAQVEELVANSNRAFTELCQDEFKL